MLDCQLILPCLNEAEALRSLLPRVPAGVGVVVVDNGSTDDTAAVARAHGAELVVEPQPGYGAAVHRGIVAATAPYVAIMDGDGSFDPADAVALLALVRFGGADLAVGRRRPVRRGLVPWHARLGNTLVLARLRRRGVSLHDLAPMRAARRDRLIELDVQDRRFGYPVELLVRAGGAGWRICEVDVRYHPRAAGTRSKVSGSVRGSVRAAVDFWRVAP